MCCLKTSARQRFGRRGFHNEKLKREEVLRDTVFLFPAEHYLDEVIVTAKQIVDGNALLKRMPKRDILEKAPPHPINEFDLGMMLDRRRRRDKEHVEKLRKIFKKLDGTDVEDPILRAYNETKREQEEGKAKKKCKVNDDFALFVSWTINPNIFKLLSVIRACPVVICLLSSLFVVMIKTQQAEERDDG